MSSITEYWAKMTPEERSQEMKRRFVMRDKRREAGLGPMRPAKRSRISKQATQDPFAQLRKRGRGRPRKYENQVGPRVSTRERLLMLESAIRVLRQYLEI